MLMNLMLHGVGNGKHENPLPMLDALFAYINRFPNVLPGDPLQKGLNICLTFDDARADFFSSILPLLKKHNLKALLAVPTAFVGTAGYCTWEMLKACVESCHVAIASHSHTHPNMLKGYDADRELRVSKKLLEEKLFSPVNTFVYPYGRCDAKVFADVARFYPYSMRIGSGYAKGWAPLMMRIPADQLKSPAALFTPQKRLCWRLKQLINYGNPQYSLRHIVNYKKEWI